MYVLRSRKNGWNKLYHVGVQLVVVRVIPLQQLRALLLAHCLCSFIILPRASEVGIVDKEYLHLFHWLVTQAGWEGQNLGNDWQQC